MQVHLKVWRQQTKASRGHFADYNMADVSPDMSQRRKRHSMRRPASVAGPAWRLAKTRVRLCSRPLKSYTWLYFPKGKSKRGNVLYGW